MILLADAEETLTLFTEGIAGHYLHVKATSEFAGNRLDLDATTSAITVDTIYLPEVLEYPDAAAFRVLTLEQLGYREFGSFAFSLEEARRRIPSLAALHPPEPTVRESDFALFYRHVEHPGILRLLHAVCERARVLACLSRRYPGMARHQNRFARYLHAHRPVPSPGFGVLLRLLERTADGLEEPTFDADHPLAVASQALLDACRAPGQSVYDAAARAFDIYQLCEPLLVAAGFEIGKSVEISGVEDWLQRKARLEEWEESLTDMDSRLNAEIAPGTELDAEDADMLEDGDLRQSDVDIRVLQSERDNLARKLEMEKSAIRDALGAVRPLARSYRYDEWDHLSRRYLRHYCRLYEERLPRDTSLELAELKQVIRLHAPTVSKRFEQIKPLGYQRVQRQSDGDELDLNAVIEARQDLRAGRSPDERVYSRRERVHRDVCAAFLVDLSASTDDPIEPPEPPPTPPEQPDTGTINLRDPYDDPLRFEPEPVLEEPRRRIIDVQRESMAIMATALEQLGDSYGIYGFSGYGRDCVEFFVAKEPDEPFNAATMEAIAGMAPKRSTRMGPAIRHATMKLTASGHALKLLIILSDGFPQDCDYGPERGDHTYGVMDTAKALEEAQNKGVETFCVTVDRSGHDYLRTMCPDARYLVIDEIEALPEALSKVYQALAGR